MKKKIWTNEMTKNYKKNKKERRPQRQIGNLPHSLTTHAHHTHSPHALSILTHSRHTSSPSPLSSFTKKKEIKILKREKIDKTNRITSFFKIIILYPGRSFRPSETAVYTTGNDYKTAKILPETTIVSHSFPPA